jgi:hypothetical protein
VAAQPYAIGGLVRTRCSDWFCGVASISAEVLVARKTRTVFGGIKHVMGYRRFSMRGLDAAKAQ